MTATVLAISGAGKPSGGVQSASASAVASYSDTVIIPGTGNGFMQIDMLFSSPSPVPYTFSFVFGSSLPNSPT